MATKELPRGIRNHNPGNLRRTREQWQGLAAAQADPSFFQFKSAVYGIRALARVLINYQDLRKAPDGSPIDTIEEIIERWAPAIENNTRAYIDHVDKLHPKAALDVVNVHDYDDLKPLVVAIIAHENKGYRYTDAEIDKALALAGVEPAQPKSLQASRTVKGAQIAGVGGLVASAAGSLAEIAPAMPALNAIADFVRDHTAFFLIGVGIAAIVGAGIAIYAKWDDRRRGIA